MTAKGQRLLMRRQPPFCCNVGLQGGADLLHRGRPFSESFINEEVDMRLISLKIVALLSAIANVDAFGGCMKPW
jgi:hypothetical protein